MEGKHTSLSDANSYCPPSHHTHTPTQRILQLLQCRELNIAEAFWFTGRVLDEPDGDGVKIDEEGSELGFVALECEVADECRVGRNGGQGEFFARGSAGEA